MFGNELNIVTRPFSDSPVRRAAIRAVLVVCFLFIDGAGTATAHDGRTNIRVELDSLSPELNGMKIELHETIAPQLVVENRTGKLLEILDDEGVAFLRIGPHGVEANLSAPDWYRTYSPGMGVSQMREADAAPRWKRVSPNSAWGWFDLRLRHDKIKIPRAIVDRGLRTEVGRWEVPMRLDGSRVALRGVFLYDPPPRFVVRTRLISPPELRSGVQVTLLPGRVPGLLMQNHSRETATVLGRQGEPFLQIGPGGVKANVRSPTWLENAGKQRVAGQRERVTGTPPEWEKVSASPSYGWIEFRALPPGGEASTRLTDQELRWKVPILIGDKRVLVTGSTILKRAFRTELVTTPRHVKAREPVALAFTMRDANELTVRNLEIVHEKPIHLLVVSNDLAEFYHIHPEAQPDGSYRVSHTFPHGGDYRLYVDYTPPGARPVVDRFDLRVAGSVRPSVALVEDSTVTKTVNGLRVTMRPSEPLRSGRELTLLFELTDGVTGKPATGLEPYLGTMAHFVVISEDLTEFLHTHPLEHRGMSGGMSGEAMPGHDGHAGIQGQRRDQTSAFQVAALTIFPRPGRYKVWAQFQRHGQVITIPYVVRVTDHK